MAERKFSRGLTKPGMAAQLRETVSQAVRETTVQNEPQRTEPIDYEAILSKGRVIFTNDPHRELLLFPPDDVLQGKVERQCRTTVSTVPARVLENRSNYFAFQCAQFYTAEWSTVTYKYSNYGGSYLSLPSRSDRPVVLPDAKHEIDMDGDLDEDFELPDTPPTHEGYLLKGPEGASEKMFVNIATKSFKRRFCKLRQDVAGSYFLDICKEEKKQEASTSIALDECSEILRNMRRNKFGFQLRLANQKSYIFAAGSETELNQWLEKLALAVHSSKIHDEKKMLQVDKEAQKSGGGPSYGTLRGLENSLNPQLTKYARETEMSIALARREGRNLLFTLCPTLPEQQSLASMGDALTLGSGRAEPYAERFGQRVVASCESIAFRLQAPVDGDKGPAGQVEPYLMSMALYDLRANKKLTEDFHFDVNEEHCRALVRTIRRELDPPSADEEWMAFPNQAVFNVRHCHSDVLLVVRVETILQGSIQAAVEPYVKPNIDAKTCLKVQKAVRSCSNRLGKYRMPFAWTARPLFRQGGQLDVDAEFPALFRQEVHRNWDDEFLKILGDFRKPEKMSRLATIPGSLRIKVDYLEMADLSNCLTSSLVPIAPFAAPAPGAGAAPPALEVAEFPSTLIDDAYPHTTYVNHLYVYPRSLKYDAQKSFHRARNLACLVQLRDSDARDALPLKCIYGLPGQARLVSQWVCPVAHHVTCPSWYDEIKVELPTPLTARHHLLFTFVHVSCEVAKQRRTTSSSSSSAAAAAAASDVQSASAGAETVVGFSWLPLLHKGRLRVEAQALPVAAQLPAGYLSFEPLGLGRGYAGPEIRWVDGQKALFQVGLELVSTVTARDQHLHNFFQHMAKLNETSSMAALFPAAAEIDAHKTPVEEAPKSPLLHDGCRELSKLIKASDFVSKILKALHAVDVAVVVEHLPVILNQLMWLLIRVNNDEVSNNVLAVLIHIVHQLHQVDKADILDTYLQFVFVTPTLSTESAAKTSVHEELVKALCWLLRPSNTDFLVVHKFLRHAGFFLMLIARSMAQFILDSGRIKMQRQERFHADYLQHLENLVQVLTPHVHNKFKELPEETRHTNLATAEFIKKCMSLMDRGFAFRLADAYLGAFRADDPRTLVEAKFQFLQWLCQHEHYVALNLPRSPNWSALKSSAKELHAEFRLGDAFCRNHYLAGLLLQQVRSALAEVADVRKVALRCLRNLLAKHELDDRYQQKGQQSRIASLYLPWILVVLDNWNRLNVAPAEAWPVPATPSASTMSLSVAAGIPARSSGQSRSLPRNTQPPRPPPAFNWQRNTLSSISQCSSPARYADGGGSSNGTARSNSSYLAIIAGQSSPSAVASSQMTLTNGESTATSATPSDDEASTLSLDTTVATSAALPEVPAVSTPVVAAATTPIVRYDKLQPDEVRDVLLCLLYVLKHVDEQALVCFWHHASQHDLICFFHVLEMCLLQFKYLGKRRLANGDGCGPAGRASTLPPRVAPPTFNARPLTAYEPDKTSVGCSADGDNVYRALLESNLTTEVGLVVLDTVGVFCAHFADAVLALDGDNALMRKVLDIYLSFLRLGQSESLSRHVFAALRAFINRFPVALFQGNAWLCGRLCCEVLRCCASKLASVRQEACAVLYLLMRSNFEFSGQRALTRVHLQVVISVSQLLGEIGGLNANRFSESLAVINGFANSDKAMQATVFPGEVRDLTKRAQTVLKATSQMRQQAQDPELLIDLQHSLANSYSATPELRKTWLDTMARHHARFGNWSEVALCNIHVAALMTEYLHCRGLRSEGCLAFRAISPNIVCDESNLRLDTGVHDTQYDEEMLLEQLEESWRAVEKAERYEMLLELHRLMTPVYEQRRDYAALANAFTRLSQACARADEAGRTRRRLLGTFFRVALYGKGRFGDEAGTEYIYKEPKVTSLSEIADRLNRLYSAKFGADNVKLAMDSNPVEERGLDASVAHIQVTHVTPYFEEDELMERPTDFERHHNVNRFMYEVPFTTDGKVRGQPEDQCKRRIILTTQYHFPYVKKRLRVVERSTEDLSPIQVALDEMRQRVQELADVVRHQPTDLKKLQLRLQGSISVQVNAGPLAYASAFLVQPTTRYPDDQVHQLRELYRDFVSICGAALDLNGKLIQADQREYHEALRGSFRDLVASLSAMLDDASLSPDCWDLPLPPPPPQPPQTPASSSTTGGSSSQRGSVLVFGAVSGNESSSA